MALVNHRRCFLQTRLLLLMWSMFPSLFFFFFFFKSKQKGPRLVKLWVRMSHSHTETHTVCLHDERRMRLDVFRISNQFWQCETTVLALDICNWWGRSDNTNSADIIWENAHISFVLYIHMNPNWCQLMIWCVTWKCNIGLQRVEWTQLAE